MLYLVLAKFTYPYDKDLSKERDIYIYIELLTSLTALSYLILSCDNSLSEANSSQITSSLSSAILIILGVAR